MANYLVLLMPALPAIVLLMNPEEGAFREGGYRVGLEWGDSEEEAKLFFAGPVLPANVFWSFGTKSNVTIGLFI